MRGVLKAPCLDRGFRRSPAHGCGASPLKNDVCEYGRNAGKEYFKCIRNTSEFSPCRFFIWKDSYVEYLRSSGIMPAETYANSQCQIGPAGAVVSPTADEITEVLVLLREMKEEIAGISEGIAAARVAHTTSWGVARTTRMIVLYVLFVWFGCVLAKNCP